MMEVSETTQQHHLFTETGEGSSWLAAHCQASPWNQTPVSPSIMVLREKTGLTTEGPIFKTELVQKTALYCEVYKWDSLAALGKLSNFGQMWITNVFLTFRFQSSLIPKCFEHLDPYLQWAAVAVPPFSQIGGMQSVNARLKCDRLPDVASEPSTESSQVNLRISAIRQFNVLHKIILWNKQHCHILSKSSRIIIKYINQKQV